MIKFKLSQPIIWIYYFCTLFFCISGYTLAHYIYPNTRVIFLLQFVAVGLLLCLAIEQIKEITLNYNKILLVIMAFFVYFRSNDIKHGYLYSPFIMFSCFILCFFMPYVKNGLIVGVRFILIGYLIYIFSTIWLFFDHKTYLGYIVNLFPTTKKQLISWYESGCIAGLTSHYSTNALYIAIGVLILAAFLLTYLQTKQKYIWMVLFTFGCVAELLTGKRGPVIYAMMALFVMYYFYMCKYPTKRTINTIGILLLLLCLLSILYFSVPQLSNFLYRFKDAEDLTNGRVDFFWGTAIKLFKKYPLAGIGWGGFLDYAKYSAHNCYLQLLCETGIIGFSTYVFSFIFFYISTAIVANKLIKNDIVEGNDKVLLLFSIGYQTYFLLSCFSENPLYDMEAYGPYFLCIAIVEYLEKKYIRGKKRID